jgi:hypothetical protein
LGNHTLEIATEHRGIIQASWKHTNDVVGFADESVGPVSDGADLGVDDLSEGWRPLLVHFSPTFGSEHHAVARRQHEA